MKTLFALITLILCMLQLSGQINPMDKLFKDRPKDLSLYINPTFQYSQIAVQHSTIAGIGAGLIINKKITVGVDGNLSFPDISLPESSGPGKLQMKWGGIHFEYTLWPLQIVHLTFPFSAGMGQLKITGNSETMTGSPNFLFLTSGLMLEFNVWKYAKLGIGTTYRYTGNVNYRSVPESVFLYSITESDLKGFAAVVSLKFGIFRYLKRDLAKFNR